MYQDQLVGAVGVSGVQSFEDAEIAQHAIQAFLAQEKQVIIHLVY